MDDITARIANLSPAKRALLQQRLQKQTTDASHKQIISRRANRNLAPLSFAQQRLWFLDQLELNSPFYNISWAVQLSGILNVGALQRVLDTIVARHEALRTTFVSIDGMTVQVIAESRLVELSVIDLSELPTAEQGAEVQHLLSREAQRPFDLSTDLMLRSTLLRLGEGEHILLLVLHHIASDGWSMGVLLQELETLYEAFSTGKFSPLPELPIQYADFAHWQQQWLTGEVLETQLTYWRKQLEGASPVLELPTDHPRLPVQTFRGRAEEFQLNSELTQRLKLCSQESGATLFITLLAVFMVLLSCYSGQTDIVVGSPIANRSRVETESLIGLFLNTLALRADLSGNPMFQEFLGRVKQVALAAYTHQDVPFEKLAQELKPARDPSRSLWFQTMFVLQNFPIRSLEIPGLTITPLRVEMDTTKFELTLSMWEAESGLKGLVTYNTDLFDPATIIRMMEHFQTLLEAVVANPRQQISELSLLTAAERHQLLVEWSNTQAEYPQDRCIHQLFETQAEQTPNAIAAVFVDVQSAVFRRLNHQLTYQQLNRKANQLARYLQRLGVKPQMLVGICVERSLEMIVALLGVIKSGGAYVPLDPAYPKEQLAYMLEDSQVGVLLTQEKLLARLPGSGALVVCLDTDWEIISQESRENPDSGVMPRNLAYVIYTSGSTGKPKGVMIEHQALVSFTKTAVAEYELSESDRVLQFASISFDAAAEEIYPCLTCGGTLVLRTHEMLSSVPTFVQKCRDLELTVLSLPTAYWHYLTSELATADLMLPKSLRLVIIGGERVVPAHVGLWQKVVGDYPQLVNTYGLTEATVVATMYKLPRSVLAEPAREVPIGRPIVNTQVYVLDPYLQPVPVGVPGELHVGGAGLARGYLNCPELTKEKFIPHPWSNEPGARLYKTGDLARYLPGGNIEFLGRLDHQVKIRGFRIEVGEIETALAQYPAVQQAVVIAREYAPGDKRLVAHVVPHQGQTPTPGELRSFLKAKLPEYMLPAAFVLLEALPLTPNGKVDRQALPAPELGCGELDTGFVCPRNDIELQLTKIWEKVLGLQPIGVKDNFFDLGGHSLFAVQLFTQIKQEIGTDLPLATLFQAPTIEQLADLLGQRSRPVSSSCLVAIQPGTSKPPFFFHGGATDALHWVKLARRLDQDQPFYALQRPDLGHTQTIQTTVKALAAQCILELQSVQPVGPYWLGGHCFGGTVAFEIAQQLQAQGEQVALLALVDAIAPQVLPNSLAFRFQVLLHKLNFQFHKNYQYHLEQLTKQGVTEKLAYLPKQLLQWAKFKAKQMIGNKLFKGKSEAATGNYLPYDLRYLVAEQRNREARMSYVSQAYSGPITLFRSSQHPLEWHCGPQFGWDKLASGVEVHVIPNFFGNLPSNPSFALLLAEKLRADSDEAQAGVEVPELNLSVGYRRTSI